MISAIHRCAALGLLTCMSCTPTRDLDALSKGSRVDAPTSEGDLSDAGVANSSVTSASTLTSAAPAAGGHTGDSSTELGGGANAGSGLGGSLGATASGGAMAGSGGAAGGEAPAALSSGGFGGDAGTRPQAAGAGGAALAGTAHADEPPPDAGAIDPTPGGDAPELPIDLPGNPVSGTFTVASDAEWEVDGTYVPTFEIITPTASYWLVKSLGTIVSIEDPNTEDPRQWIAFSSSFRPLRGLPSLGTFDSQEPMTSTNDEDSQTPTHLRILSVSQSGNWRLVYDFYPTHVTLTVNAAPMPYGIAYRGVPGGSLEDSDQFVFADGSSQSAILSSVADLAGPAEWAYLADTALGRSLFMVQHMDDDQVDRYQVKDSDSAMLSFGDGELTRLPMRFSFGLVESADHETVASRASFVINAID
jgi:hypothetical protein